MIAAACGESGLVEPDNHHHQALAFAAKRGLGSFPVLGPGDEAPRYADHWRRIFAGRWPRFEDAESRAAARRLEGMDRDALDAALLAPREHAGLFEEMDGLSAGFEPPPDREPHLVVKSVQLCMAIEWFAELMPEVRIVMVERHPLDVTASWLAQYGDELGPPPLDWRRRFDGDTPEPPPATAAPIERIAWKVGLLARAQRRSAERLGCRIVRHEDMCAAAESRFADLARELDLPWPEAAAAKAAQTDRPGGGYEINRIRAGLPGSARRRLRDADAEAARRALDAFELDYEVVA